MRMYEAQDRGDMNAYFIERQKVEAIESDDSYKEFEESFSEPAFQDTPVIPRSQPSAKNSAPVVDTLDSDGYRLSDDALEEIVSSKDPRIQAGQLFDEVETSEDNGVNFSRYSRRREGVYAGEPYSIRIQANRALSKEEAYQMAGLVGYQYQASVRGEGLGEPYQDTPFSFIISADTTKSASDDIGMALERFENGLPDTINQGSPIRTTDRAGAGTKGTRKAPGFEEPKLKIDIFYDSVYRN